jgi:hypothetical protein
MSVVGLFFSIGTPLQSKNMLYVPPYALSEVRGDRWDGPCQISHQGAKLWRERLL